MPSARFTAPSSPRTTPLHLAAATGDAALILKLLEEGADINAQDCRGDTPMSIATGVGNRRRPDFEKLMFWIELGANPSIRNFSGHSVWWACGRSAQDQIHVVWAAMQREDARRYRSQKESLSA